MGLRAPHEMGKVTQEQERVKSRTTLPSYPSQGSVGSRDHDLILAGQGAPSLVAVIPVDAWLPRPGFFIA